MYDYITIYKHGLENISRIYGCDFSNLRNLKVLLYYIVTIFISPYTKVNFQSIYFVNGKSQRKMQICESCDTIVYRGLCYDKLDELWSFNTFLCKIGFLKRVTLFLKSLLIFKKNKLVNFASWLEFCYILRFLQITKIERVVSRGHYDEISTWLGDLSKELGFKFVIYQHGIVSKELIIPHRIYCSDLYAFDNYSQQCFSKNYVEREFCKFHLRPFQSNINFDIIRRKEGYLYIGLAEQVNSKWVKMIIEEIRKLKRKIIFVIMLHPFSHNKYIGDDIILMPDKKYFNLDAIITYNSTLLLDYYSKGYSNGIFFTDEKSIDCFRDYPFIFVSDVSLINNYLVYRFADSNGMS